MSGGSFTNSLAVVVDDATKASDMNAAYDNTEFNRELADAYHDFDISTGDGAHKGPMSITAPDDTTHTLALTNTSYDTDDDAGLVFTVEDGGDVLIDAVNTNAGTYNNLTLSGDDINFNVEGAQIMNLSGGATWAQLAMDDQDLGSTTAGPHFVIGRNTNSGGVGYLQLTSANGSGYQVWVENDGTLRIGASGTTVRTTNQGSYGSVVGSQT